MKKSCHRDVGRVFLIKSFQIQEVERKQFSQVFQVKYFSLYLNGGTFVGRCNKKIRSEIWQFIYAKSNKFLQSPAYQGSLMVFRLLQL